MLGIVDGFGIPRLLAGLAPGGFSDLLGQSSNVDSGKRSGDHLRRREFGKTILVSMLPGAGALPGTAEPADLAKLKPDEVVADLYALDDQFGGGTVADIAERRVASILSQLQAVSIPVAAETRMHRMMGTLCVCAGWVAHDAGQDDRAARLYKDALYAAHLANDKPLRMHILSNMSMQATALDRPRDGLHLAQAALGDARGADPRLRSLLAMRVARAASQQRDERLLRQSYHDARRLLDRAGTDADQSSWFRFFDEMEVTGLAGICYVRIGRFADAAVAFRKVIGHSGTYPRNRAVYMALLAESLAGARQVDEAVDVVHRGLPLFTQVTSARMRDRLADVDSALASYMDVSDVAECREILAGLTA
ncbi:MAG TPA: hypothetical protein VF070_25480 [Streptosporangiaceae bacterium]